MKALYGKLFNLAKKYVEDGDFEYNKSAYEFPKRPIF